MLSRALIKKQRGRRPLTFVAIAGLLSSLVLASGTALAVWDESFQLEGNVVDDAGASQPFDWANFFDANGQASPTLPDASRPGFEASGFERDFRTNTNGSFNTADPTTFATGSKDTLPITPGWQCNFDNNVNSKTDVMNAYAVTFSETEDAAEEEILYFALERNANTGTGNVGFWFLQDAVACESPGGSTAFTGNHVDGDLLVVSEFSNGGAVATIQVYRWDGGANGTLNPNAVASGASCSNAAGDATVCAIVNTGTIQTPWLTANKQDGVGDDLRVSEFFEAGLNLTQANLGGKCFNTFIADTRSSTSLTATIFDFALGTLGSCTSETETTPSETEASIGTDGSIVVTDEATVTVDGADDWEGTVQFYICGPTPGIDTCAADEDNELGDPVAITDATVMPITSDDAEITEAGDYCFAAVFSGDEEAGVPGSDDLTSDECFTITPVDPTLDTLAGTSPVDLGDPVTDTATLAGTANQPGTGGIGTNGSINPETAGGPADGTITFTLVKQDDCSTLAASNDANEDNPQDVTVSGDDDYNASFTPNAPGTYSWKAVYSGDGPNTNGATHNADCTDTDEDVTVRQVPTSISSAQNVILNDSATIGSTISGVDLPAGGEVIFELFGPTAGKTALQNCQADDGTGELFEQKFDTLGGAETETFNTTNTTSVSTSATYYWKVTYDPKDTGFTGRQSNCSEATAVTFTNDAGPGTLFP